jgi:hypothetical protein
MGDPQGVRRLSMASVYRVALGVVLLGFVGYCPASGSEQTYSQQSILQAANDFFGETTKGLAEVVEKAFREQGRPNAYIQGQDVGVALTVGVRYGEGELHTKRGGVQKLYWQGPSIGFDLGVAASKVFILVYHLPTVSDIFQRFPGVDGSLYYVGGVGITYLRSGDITLAPVRLGAGLRIGASVGYMDFTRKHSWIPF